MKELQSVRIVCCKHTTLPIWRPEPTQFEKGNNFSCYPLENRPVDPILTHVENFQATAWRLWERLQMLRAVPFFFCPLRTPNLIFVAALLSLDINDWFTQTKWIRSHASLQIPVCYQASIRIIRRLIPVNHRLIASPPTWIFPSKLSIILWASDARWFTSAFIQC